MNNNEVIRLLTEMKESLEREMASLKESLQGEMTGMRQELAGMNKRFDHITDVYERHSDLIAADVLNIRGMEHSVLKHDKAIFDLTARVEKLEGQK